MTNAKKKGNSFENKISKILGQWMFEDIHALARHHTSGAQKQVYCGDIIPIKQLDQFKKWNIKSFPFLIETKTGYTQFIPTIWSYTKIMEWYIKSYQESLINNQNIIFLICQFKNKKTIFLTNYLLDQDKVLFTSAFPIKINGEIHYLYCYLFKELIQNDFHSLFNLKEIEKQ